MIQTLSDNLLSGGLLSGDKRRFVPVPNDGTALTNLIATLSGGATRYCPLATSGVELVQGFHLNSSYTIEPQWSQPGQAGLCAYFNGIDTFMGRDSKFTGLSIHEHDMSWFVLIKPELPGDVSREFLYNGDGTGSHLRFRLAADGTTFNNFGRAEWGYTFYPWGADDLMPPVLDPGADRFHAVVITMRELGGYRDANYETTIYVDGLPVFQYTPSLQSTTGGLRENGITLGANRYPGTSNASRHFRGSMQHFAWWYATLLSQEQAMLLAQAAGTAP